MAAAAVAQKAPSKKAIPSFFWEGKTKNGEKKKGEMEASDQGAVEARLRSMGIVDAKIRQRNFFDDFTAIFAAGVQGKDILIFTRQFSTMIDAGLPLVQCLEILGSQADNPAFQKVIYAVKNKVEAGSTFADSLKDHPKVFDELFVQLCAAGEMGGILDTILNRLAAYREKNEKLKRKVKSALNYPVIVLVVGIGVVAALLLKVVPVFAKMFADFGSALPAPTQFFVDASAWMQAYYIHLALGIAGFVFGFKTTYENPKGRKLIDKTALKVPVVGDLIRKVAVARFTRTLGTMISSGVPILDALDVVAKTAGNRTIEEAIYHVRAKIAEGKNIAGPLAETGVFPSMVVQMIGVGEATGAMDGMLNKIADFYDDEVDTGVAGLTSLIEPIMMVGLGGVVGGFLIAMYLPIFTIASAIK
jgi:type IV pilus assembly protein PilC